MFEPDELGPVLGKWLKNDNLSTEIDRGGTSLQSCCEESAAAAWQLLLREGR